GCRGRVREGVLEGGLGGGVHDQVDAVDELVDEVAVTDVPVDERKPRMREHVGEVLEAARVRERVERDDLVVGRLEQVADHVRRDEPRPAGDENALHSSSATEYKGLPSTSRWILPRYSPISARMNPCIPRTKTIPVPAKSGPGKLLSMIQYTIPQMPSATAAVVQTTPSATPIHCTGCGQKPPITC